VIRGMANLDAAVDAIVYRPAVVKAFAWLPRWWSCDLAKLSMALDGRWKVGYWDEAGIAPGRPCDACGRRASIHVLGDPSDDRIDEDDDRLGGPVVFLSDRSVHVCGWCHVHGRITSSEELAVALDEARARSVAWRWR
jgi:hypothetical protein